jgi:formate dehydrogenase maturation protein FdhE
MKSNNNKPSNLGYQFKNLKETANKEDDEMSSKISVNINEKPAENLKVKMPINKEKAVLLDNIINNISDKKKDNIKNVIPKLSKKEQKLKEIEAQKDLKNKEIEN